ncbi:MAG: ArsR/SmtB family transcription factor [bacterium]
MAFSMTSAERLKVLADRTRLTVMEYLMEGPKHVGELAALLQVEQSLLSHHLRVLREAELVLAVREGKAVRYQLAPEAESLSEKNAIDLGSYKLFFESAKAGSKSK